MLYINRSGGNSWRTIPILKSWVKFRCDGDRPTILLIDWLCLYKLSHKLLDLNKRVTVIVIASNSGYLDLNLKSKSRVSNIV